jgi:hypothetical protein
MLMHPKHVISIIPRLPPRVDGVGDYALAIARSMNSRHNVRTTFIVMDPGWDGPGEIEGFSVKKIDSRAVKSLIKLVGHNLTAESAVILHYVGYGYARRGCPLWLIRGLSSLKKERSFRLVTMFHELFAMGPVWTSQFWLSPLQRYLVKKLASISDQKLTSLNRYQRMIGAKFSQPVISNIGEPDVVPPLSVRNKQLVIFGSPGPRERVYKFSQANLEKICRVFNITTIVDVGAPVSIELPVISGVSIVKTGVLSKEEISDLLRSSMIGFFNYPSTYLSKSGIFAAYCAHGVLPVGHYYPEQTSEEAIEGETFLFAEHVSSDFSMGEAEKIAGRAFSWYQGHRSEIHAEHFYRSLT